jgi:hypothetical protein
MKTTIDMAREAGESIDKNWLERFAALVRADEREACAKVCRSEADRALWNFQNDLPQNESFWNGAEQMASSCENAIRARGNA